MHIFSPDSPECAEPCTGAVVLLIGTFQDGAAWSLAPVGSFSDYPAQPNLPVKTCPAGPTTTEWSVLAWVVIRYCDLIGQTHSLANTGLSLVGSGQLRKAINNYARAEGDAYAYSSQNIILL